jgi:hypothetical protein
MASNAACVTGSPATSNALVMSVNSCTNVTLNLKLFIEGFYRGNGTMAGILSAFVTDSVNVQLAASLSPHSILFSVSGVISTNGNGSFIFPYTASGNSYYIVVKQRNSIETWSSQPVNFSGSSASYDFSDFQNKAYGNNLSSLGDGNFALWSGDISDATSGLGNQDGIIESQDYSDEENAVNQTLVGYRSEDLNGDGVVESDDYGLMENNVYFSKFAMRP